MFRAYPYFMAANDETRSSNGGFLTWFFGWLFGRSNEA